MRLVNGWGSRRKTIAGQSTRDKKLSAMCHWQTIIEENWRLFTVALLLLLRNNGSLSKLNHLNILVKKYQFRAA
ncbi:hypothetical protein CHISP_3167 [Chitinispirillum alkaliphilum]|nr:hypothetical protein CHISP_3167 [Chitinispirillum alkaliphilum]